MEKIVKTARIALVPLLIRDILAFVIIVGVFWLIRDLISYASERITLYEGHIEGKVGVIRTKKLNSPLDKVQSVSVSSGLFGKIFNYGTVTVTTAASTISFQGIAGAKNFEPLVNEQIEKAAEAKMMKQAQLMAQAMKQ